MAVIDFRTFRDVGVPHAAPLMRSCMVVGPLLPELMPDQLLRAAPVFGMFMVLEFASSVMRKRDIRAKGDFRSP